MNIELRGIYEKVKIWNVAILSSMIIIGATQLTFAAAGWQQYTQGNWQYIENDKKATNRWIQDDSGNWRFAGDNE